MFVEHHVSKNAIASKIILERVIRTMPCCNVEGCVVLFAAPELACLSADDGVLGIIRYGHITLETSVEESSWDLKVAHVCEASASDRA